MDREIELLIRKSTLKDLEQWLLREYIKIDAELKELKQDG